MPLQTPVKNTAADAVAPHLAFVSLHTGDPGSTGASEVAGGNPAYARKALVFPAAANGATSATEVTFDAPAGAFSHFGIWSAATGGTFRGGGTLAVTQTLASQGQVKVTVSLTVS